LKMKSSTKLSSTQGLKLTNESVTQHLKALLRRIRKT